MDVQVQQHMRLRVMSDLHLDFHPDGGQAFLKSLDLTGIDVLVLAGDTCSAAALLPILRYFCSHVLQVVLVAGNHEYYGASPRTVAALRERCQIQFSNLSWLENNVAQVAGHRFIGATLWFSQTPDSILLRFFLNDFKNIADFEPWVYRRNVESLTFLKKNIKPGDVVITHHAPSFKCVPIEWRGQVTNCFYVCDLENLISHKTPNLWVHGHIHRASDWTLGDTRILCNPLGYIHREGETGFNPDLTVEVL